MNFNELGLGAEILRAVGEAGYHAPTPIQAKAIPVILQGHDLMAAAQTGTGKTAGFALPILQCLANRRAPTRGKPRALVLTPTRELAAQVAGCFNTYSRHLPLKTALVFGGVGMLPQIKALRAGVDVLVATPGRLLDHLRQKTVDLSAVEILVLDEADRMLDMGFIHDIRKVLTHLPKRRQSLLFSATFSDEIRSLATGLLNQPQSVEVAARNAAADQVRQHVHPVDKTMKRDVLIHLITEQSWHQVLVFTRTKHGANTLADKLLKAGIQAAAIHGNKSQNARERALADFKKLKLNVLVATDIAARGLDIAQLPRVVNFELPQVPEDYVHRIGRTGRAGQTGHAVSLVCTEELGLLQRIERLLRQPIEKIVVPGFEPVVQAGAPPSSKPPRGHAPHPERGERKPFSDRAGARSDPSSRKPAKTAQARTFKSASGNPGKPQRQRSAARHSAASHPARNRDY